MLNPAFAQVGWRPDPSTEFCCSSLTRATEFTYLMVLVMSGRDAITGKLARQIELDALLSTPEATDACKQTNSQGWTALMLAARNSGQDSTDETVAQLLAQENSEQVARMQDNKNNTALMYAVRYSRTESTKTTVAQLLAHESSEQTTRMQYTDGWTLLMVAVICSNTSSTNATVSQVLMHESSKDMICIQNNHGCNALMIAVRNSTPATVAQMLTLEITRQVVSMKDSRGVTALKIAAVSATQEMVATICPYADADDVNTVSLLYPNAFHTYFCRLHQSAQERAILSNALRQGLSLVEATTLLYL
jgi:ankyrin repeat protein